MAMNPLSPHLHCLVSDGLFLPDGSFLPVLALEPEIVMRAFRHRLQKALLAQLLYLRGISSTISTSSADLLTDALALAPFHCSAIGRMGEACPYHTILRRSGRSAALRPYLSWVPNVVKRSFP